MRISKKLYNGYVQLVLEINEVSVDKLNNKSTIEWELWLERVTTYVYNLDGTSVASVKFNDEVILNKNVLYDLRNVSKVTFGKGQKEIAHDEDGRKAFTVQARLTDVGGLADIDWFSGTVPLTDIERESQIKKVIATELGQPVEIQIDRKIPDFRHQAWYRINGSSWFDLGDKIAYAKMFVPTIDLATHIPNSDTGVIDVCVRTYLGDKQIGNDVYVRDTKIKVPENIVPTFERIEIEDMNKNVSKILPELNFLTNNSKISATIVNASGLYGATITKHVVRLNNSVSHWKQGIFNYFTPGNHEIIAEVTDSRGRTFRRTQQVTIHDYSSPKINVFLPLRSGNRTNKNVRAQTSVNTHNVRINGRELNEYTLKVEYSLIDSSRTNKQWTIAFRENSTQTNYVKTIDLGNLYELANAYDFRLTVTDKFGSSVRSEWGIGTAKVLAVFSKNGFSLGEIPEDADKDLFNCAMPAKFKNSVNFMNDVVYKGRELQVHQLTNKDGSPLTLPSVDLNKVVRTGVYSLIYGTILNSPKGITSTGIVEVNTVTDGSSKLTTQTLHSNGKMYYRELVVNTWTEWTVLYGNALKWKKPTLSNKWEHHSGYGDVFFARDDNTVYLRGNAWNGAETYDTIIFTLPADCAPTANIFVRGLNNNYKDAVMLIDTRGNVKVRSACTKEWVNFDNISFKI